MIKKNPSEERTFQSHPVYTFYLYIVHSYFLSFMLYHIGKHKSTPILMLLRNQVSVLPFSVYLNCHYKAYMKYVIKLEKIKRRGQHWRCNLCSYIFILYLSPPKCQSVNINSKQLLSTYYLPGTVLSAFDTLIHLVLTYTLIHLVLTYINPTK